MDTKTFLDNFAAIAEAPGGVQRLRDVVMELAARGKLVEQLPEEQEAASLLARIADERAALIASGKRRRQKARNLPDRARPEGWRAVDLGTVLDLEYGKALPAKEREASGRVPVYGSNGIVGYHDTALVAGPCVVVGRKGSAGAINVSQGPCWPIDTAYFVEPLGGMSVEFVALLLRASRLDELDRSTAVPGLNREDAYAVSILLPPLAEQERIVTKVDELMSLCDDLEARHQRRHRATTHFRASALHALTEADAPDDLRRVWALASSNWSALSAESSAIDDLRSCILRLAVMGRLGTQDPEDEPAPLAIDRAAKGLSIGPRTKGREAAIQRLPGDAALSVGPPTDLVLPAGWAAVPLSSVARLESGHTPDRKVPSYWNGPFPWLGIRDARLHRDGVIHRTEATVTQAGIDNSSTRLLPEGTVCLSRTASVGYCVVLGRPMCTSQDFVNFVCTEALAPRYLQLVFMAEHGALRRFAKGAVHLTIYFPEVKALHLLVPPRAEQDRIVGLADGLLARADTLRAQLRSQELTKERLAASAANALWSGTAIA